MFCGNCGNKLKDGARFCPFCGAPVENIESAYTYQTMQQMPNVAENNPNIYQMPQQAPASNNNRKVGVIAILAAAIAAVIVVCVIRFSSQKDNELASNETKEVSAEEVSAEETSVEEMQTTETTEEIVQESVDFDEYLYGRWEGVYDASCIDNDVEIYYDRINNWLPAWYDEDGFAVALKQALYDAGEHGQWSWPDLNTDKVKYCLVISDNYIGMHYNNSDDDWKISGCLKNSSNSSGGGPSYKQTGDNTVRFYSNSSDKGVEVTYSFQMKTGELTITLNDSDYRLVPYITSEQYTEGLNYFKENSFLIATNGASATWSADSNFKTFLEKEFKGDGLTLTDSQPTYSYTHIYENSIMLYTSNNDVGYDCIKWTQTEPGAIELGSSEGHKVRATFTINTDKLVLTINGASYYFTKVK